MVDREGLLVVVVVVTPLTVSAGGRVKTETNLTVEIFAYRPTCLLSLHLMLGLTGSLVLRTSGVVEWRTAGSLVAPRGK